MTYYIEHCIDDFSPEGEEVHVFEAEDFDEALEVFDSFCRAQPDDEDYSLSDDGSYLAIYSLHHKEITGCWYGDRIKIG